VSVVRLSWNGQPRRQVELSRKNKRQIRPVSCIKITLKNFHEEVERFSTEKKQSSDS
jgi:hypothetical protein